MRLFEFSCSINDLGAVRAILTQSNYWEVTLAGIHIRFLNKKNRHDWILTIHMSIMIKIEYEIIHLPLITMSKWEFFIWSLCFFTTRLRLVWCISLTRRAITYTLCLQKKRRKRKLHYNMYFILHVLTTITRIKNGSLLLYESWRSCLRSQNLTLSDF